MTVYDCSIIELIKHHTDRQGNLTVVENGITVPFDVKRVFYIYDVPGGISRGGHAHYKLRQLLVAVSGSFTVTLDDGKVRRTFLLNHPYQGLMIEAGIWNHLDDFSSGAICMALTSDIFKEEDYIRDYNRFIEWRKEIEFRHSSIDKKAE